MFFYGGNVYCQTNAALTSSGVLDETLQYREDGITVDGVELQDDGTYAANTTKISAEKYWQSVSDIASEFVYDQTNIRLREVALTYNFPQSLIGNTFIKGASVGLVGRNLFFIYKDMDNFDPEASLGTANEGQGIISYCMPTARSIGFNVNIKF